MDQLFDEIEALCEAAVVSAFVKGTIPTRKSKPGRLKTWKQALEQAACEGCFWDLKAPS